MRSYLYVSSSPYVYPNKKTLNIVDFYNVSMIPTYLHYFKFKIRYGNKTYPIFIGSNVIKRDLMLRFASLYS